MGNRSTSIIPLVLLFLLPLIPSVAATRDYNNYLYSLEISYFTDPVIAGGTGSVIVVVGANMAVDVHIEFKGQLQWGEWTFSSVVISIPNGEQTVTGEVDVPYKTIIEPTSEFYYYVYVTLPGDSWSPQAWGLVQPVTVIHPPEVTHEELVALISHLKWLVDTSSLSEGIKTSLFSKLYEANLKIDSAYNTGNLKQLNGAIGSLKAFINELNSNKETSSYPDSALWKDQAKIIIERIELAKD